MSEPPPDPPTLEHLRDHVWKYFSFHAEQRIKTFNFYVLFSTILIGGLLAFLKDTTRPAIGVVPLLVLMLVSFFFWQLDCRSRQLIDYSREALRAIELQLNT